MRQGGTPAGGGGMYDMREWLSPTVGSLKEENDIRSYSLPVVGRLKLHGRHVRV